MSYNNKKFLDANGVTQIVSLLDDYATNETLSTVVNSVQTALDQKVDDVQIDGTSILNNGTANVPIASSSNLGVVKVNSAAGIMITSGTLATNPASDAQIKTGTNGNRPICATSAPNFTFYGLAKAAGHDEKDSSEPLGTYTDGAKEAIQKMLGFEDILGNYETSSTASKSYIVGETFIFNGKRYRATANIAQNYVITPGTNCELAPISLSDIQINGISILNNDVANIPFASPSTLGVVKVSDRSEGLMMNSTNGLITIAPAGNYAIKMGTSSYNPITPDKQHMSVFYGLATAAGDTTQSASNNAVGTYTLAAATAIKTMLQVQEGLKVVRLI